MRGPGRGVLRRRAAAAVALLLLAWGVVGLGTELHTFRQRIAGHDHRLRLDSPMATELRRLAEAAAPHLPADALVALAAPGQPRDAEYFLALWAGYALPSQRVVPFHRQEKSAAADYIVVIAGAPVQQAAAEAAGGPEGAPAQILVSLPGGALLRRR